VKILRKSEAAARLGCGLSTFHEKYVKPGRVKLIYLGKRSVGALESDTDRVIGELVAESAAHPNRRALAPKPKRGRGRPAREAVAQAQVVGDRRNLGEGLRLSEMKTENRETENRETENRETENRETENRETENRETENRETENRETENRETKNREPRTENQEPREQANR
jgi:hypothetical protein